MEHEQFQLQNMYTKMNTEQKQQKKETPHALKSQSTRKFTPLPSNTSKKGLEWVYNLDFCFLFKKKATKHKKYNFNYALHSNSFIVKFQILREKQNKATKKRRRSFLECVF